MKLSYSPISIWELIVLLGKKKFKIKGDFGAWFEEAKTALDLKEALLDCRIVRHMRFLMLGYKDPVDRFLAAPAQACGLTLVTADPRWLDVPGIKTLANV